MAAGTIALKGEGQANTKRRTPTGDAYRQLIRNKAAVVSIAAIGIMVFVAIFVDTAVLTIFTGNEPQPLLAPYHYAEVNFAYTDEPPMTRTEDGNLYILGTDYLGRDTLSRTMYGTRISLAVAVVASTVSLIVGLVYGLTSGYSRSSIDNFMMRFVDFLYGFPLIIFIILMQVYFKALSTTDDTPAWAASLIKLDRSMGGILFVFIAIGLISWLGMARIARGQTLSYKNKEFVEAAHSVGSSDRRIVFSHLLPNILGPCIVAETLAIPGYILTEAFLSFIGLGANPPTPSWGMMISETYQAMRVAPFEVFVPAAALTITTLAFNFLGDGLRDAFDPRLRG